MFLLWVSGMTKTKHFCHTARLKEVEGVSMDNTKILLDIACENLRRAMLDPRASTRRENYLATLEAKWKGAYLPLRYR